MNHAAGTPFARQSNPDIKTGEFIPKDDRRMSATSSLRLLRGRRGARDKGPTATSTTPAMTRPTQRPSTSTTLRPVFAIA